MHDAEHEDKRRYPRANSVHLAYVEEHDGEFCERSEMARTLDMSVTGSALEVRHPYDIGTNLAVSLLMGNEIVDGEARVIRCDQMDDDRWDLGLEYLYVPKRYWRLLSHSFADRYEA